MNAKHELKYVRCFVCLVPRCVGGSLYSSARGTIELAARGKLPANVGALDGKEWDGYQEEGPRPGTCVSMTFPRVHLLHGIEGHGWQERAFYIYLGIIVLL